MPFRVLSELARAAVDHQTSVAPSKRTVNLTSKSLETSKPSRARPAHRSSNSVDWAAEGKEGWLVGAKQEGPLSGARSSASVTFARESSTEASGEDVPLLPDLRISGDSVDSSGGEGAEGPLRIWPPGTATLSRENQSADATFLIVGDARSSSPTRSAESETELLSPIGFWQEKFETIDARNATRQFSGWGDTGSGEEVSPDREAGASDGVDSDRAGWAGDGRPPRNDAADPAVLRDRPEAGVGRKLFPSPERQRPPPVVSKQASSNPLAANLETMVEGDHEFPSPMGPLDSGSHPQPFWATPVEPDRESVGGGGSGSDSGPAGGVEERGTGGLGWRRGEAGLVVPEPLPPKSRSVTIQQVVPQRASRIGEGSVQGGDGKRPLSVPRPSTTSPTLPTSGEHKSKAPTELQLLTPGVKIVRSYSYHGLGSMALYDAANRG